jgi:hypothetical protein
MNRPISISGEDKGFIGKLPWTMNRAGRDYMTNWELTDAHQRLFVCLHRSEHRTHGRPCMPGYPWADGHLVHQQDIRQGRSDISAELFPSASANSKTRPGIHKRLCESCKGSVSLDVLESVTLTVLCGRSLLEPADFSANFVRCSPPSRTRTYRLVSD